MRYKILFFTFKPPYPASDGGKICTWATIKALLQSDCEVDLLTLSYREDPARSELFSAAQKEGIRQVIKAEINATPSINKVLSSLVRKYPDRTWRFFDEKAAVLLKKVISEGQYDAVIFDHLSTGQYLWHLQKEGVNMPTTIYRSHNIESEIWEGMRMVTTNLALKAFLFMEVPKIRNFEKWMAQSVDYVWSLSPQDIQVYRSWRISAKKLYLVRAALPSLPSPIQLPENLPRRVVLTHIGSLAWLPNYYSMKKFLNEVWLVLRQRFQDIEVVIGGKRSDEFNLLEGVKGLGFVDDVSEVIAHSPFYFIPVYVGSGIRIKLLEALAYQRIVLTTSKGAQGFEGRHKEHVIIADSVEEWESAIKWILENWGEAVEMAKRGRKLVEEIYSVDGVSRVIRQLVETI